jgi:hypothetical protein
MIHTIVLCDGKYTIIFNDDPQKFDINVERYGEPWRLVTGDNLILALIHKIIELQEQLKGKVK